MCFCWQVPVVSEKQFLLIIQNSCVSAGATPRISSSSTASTVASASLKPLSRVVKGSSQSSASSQTSHSLTRVPSTGLAPDASAAQQELSQLLWVDKYKPSRLEDVIGGAESVKKLLEWLRKWHDVHIHKTAKVRQSVRQWNNT